MMSLSDRYNYYAFYRDFERLNNLSEAQKSKSSVRLQVPDSTYLIAFILYPISLEPILFQSHWPPSVPRNEPSSFSPQHLRTCCFLCLEGCSSLCCLAGSFVRCPSKLVLLTLLYNITMFYFHYSITL